MRNFYLTFLMLFATAFFAPAIAQQTFCAANHPTVAQLQTPSPNQSVYWYTTATGGTALNLTDALQTGTYYAAVVTYGAPTVFASGLDYPFGIARLSNGTVLVGGGSNISSNIYRLNADSTGQTLFASGFNGVYGITQLSNTDILVSDGNNTVKRLSASGTPLDTLDANIAGPRGIVERADGTILIASYDSGSIYSYDANGNKQTFASGLSGPAGMIQTADGKIWVAEWYGKKITRFNADGSNRTSIATPSSYSNPSGIVQTATGKLWVSFSGGQIVQYNADGTNPVTIATGLGNLRFMTQQPDGTVLVASIYAGRVYALTPAVQSNRVAVQVVVNTVAAPTANNLQVYTGDSQTLNDLTITGTNIQWYDAETGGNSLSATTALISGTTYYASQTENGCESARAAITVHRISDTEQTFCGAVAPTTADLAGAPFGNTAPTWYTTATGGTALNDADALQTGTYYAEIASDVTSTTFASGLDYPYSIAQLTDGTVLVGEYDGNIYSYNADGTGKTLFASGFNTVSGITQLSNTDILVSDYYNFAVKRLSASGTLLGIFDANISFPRGIVELTDDRVLIISSSGLGSIYSYNANGTNKQPFASDLSNPDRMIQTADGEIWVTEWGSNQITRFDANGNNQPSITTPYSGPAGIVQTATGKIWVSFDYSYQIVQYDADGTNPIDIATVGSVSGYMIQQPDGTVLVTSYDDGTVYALTPAVQSNRVAVQVVVNTVAAPTANALQVYTGDSQTLNDLEIAGTNIQWYDAETGGNSLPATTALISGTTYYASQTENGCESTRIAITVHRISDDEQTFCDSDAPTVADLAGTPFGGTAPTWYTSATGDTPLNSTDALQTGTYYAEIASDGTPTVFASGLSGPGGIAQLTDNTVLIGGNDGNIYSYNADGTGKTLFASGFNTVTGITQLDNGDILVSDYGDNAVKRLSSVSGTLLDTLDANISSPTGIVERADGSVLVASQGSGIIYSYDTDGTNQQTFASGLNNPQQMIQTDDGKIWVTETNGNQITRFDADGNNPTSIPTYSGPIGIIQTTTGKIWVSFSGGQIVQYDDDGTNPVDIATGLGNNLRHMTQQPNGTVLVASMNDGKVYALTPAMQSNRVAVQVVVNTVAAPTANTLQIYTGDSQTLNDLEIAGTNIQWYDAETDGNSLSATTALISGTTYYASQTKNGCESTRVAITVHRISDDEQTFCDSDAPTVADLAGTPFGSTAPTWYTSATGGTPLNSTDSLQTGTYYAEIASDGTPTVFASGLDHPYSIAQLTDGTVLVGEASGSSSNIYRFNADGTGQAVFASDFYIVTDITQLDNTDILVSDAFGNTVKRFTALGASLGIFANISAPKGIVELADGTVLVASINGGIYSYDDDGNQQTFASGLSYPEQMIRTADGKIWVTEWIGDKITRFDDDGTHSTSITTPYSKPSGIIQTATGKIWVSFDGGQIVQYDADGSNPIDIATVGGGLRHMTQQPNGTVLVASIDDNTVYALTPIQSNRVAVQVVVNTVAAPTVNTPLAYSYGATAQLLTATAATGNSLLWYENETGGTGSSTAPTPATNVVGTQSYWVSQITADGCESPRTKIVVNITPATLTVTADANQSKIYGTADPTLTYTVTGLANGDTEAAVLSGALSRDAGEAVGSYAITQGTLVANGDYDITFVSDDFEITKAQLTVTADANQSKVYGTTDPTLTYHVDGLANGDTEAAVLSGTLSRDAGEAVDSYAITQGTLVANGDYEITFVSDDFEITKATLTVTADANQNKVYGTADPTLTYTVTGLANGDTEAMVLSGALGRDAGEAVGSYAITQGSLVANGDYDITFVSNDFEITKATLTVTADADQSKVYGTADPILTYTVTGLANGDTEAMVLSGTLSRDAGEAVGSYAITQGTLVANGDYDITFVSDNFEITKATLTVTADANQNKVYGTADPTLTYTVTGLANGDTEATVLSGTLDRDAGEAVGSYAITQGTLTANGDYNITFVSNDFEITKARLTVTADANQSKIYGTADPTLTYHVDGLANGDTEAAVLSGALDRDAGEAVGNYAITQGSLVANGDYDITFVSDDFEITKAQLTVTADANQSKVYGTTDPTLTYTVTGLANGDTEATVLSGALSRDAGEAVGSYAITQGTLVANGDYDITFVSDDFEITKAQLTVTANADQSKVYGTVDPTLTYTVTGLANGDTEATVLSGALSRDAGEAVGSYAITQGSLVANGDYEITFVSDDFEITKATLTVTADANQSKVYGTADPTLTYTVTGFLFNDDESIFSGALDRTAGENVGTYPINQGTLSAGANYDIVFVPADFAITPAMLTVVPHSGQSKVYGSASPTYLYTVTGLVNGDTPAVISGILGRVAGENVGTYNYNVGTLTAQHNNYTLTVTLEHFSITPAPITVTVDSGQSKPYGSGDPVFAYTATGLVNGDTQYAVFTGSLQRAPGENVGTYPIGQGTLQPNGNYELMGFTGADFEIVKAVIHGVTLNSAQFVYDGTPKSLSVSGNIQPNAQITYTGNGQINAGTYTVTATVDYGSNYEVLTLTATLKIVPATQTITFEVASPVVLEDTSPFNLEATASSGLEVYYTYAYIENEPATISPSGQVTLLTPGVVEITAHQDGNNNYAAAAPVTRRLVVESRDSSIWNLYIDGVQYKNPSEETHVLIGCDDSDSSSVEIRVETQLGATVAPSEVIVVPTPEYGTYEVEIVVTSQNGQHSQTYKVIIVKRLPWEGVLMQKYDNLVFVNNNPATNGGYRFVRYEWYKNGVKVADEQMFSEGATMNDVLDPQASYYAVLYTNNGKVLTTCEMGIQLKHDYNLSVYPNPVVQNSILNVRYDVPEEEFKGGEYLIFSTSGQFIKRGKLTQTTEQITIPPTLSEAVYLLILKVNGKTQTVRFVVKANE